VKKIRYYYNINTLRYEKQVVPLRVTLFRILAFISAAVVTGLLIVTFAFKFLDSPKEKLLRVQIEKAEELNRIYASRFQDIDERMKELENRDNEIYRTVFEATPIPDSARAKNLEDREHLQNVARMDNNEMAAGIFSSLNALYNRLDIQEKSYKEIEGMIKNKEKLLASTPAIQPLSNRDLNRLSSGFGYRIDPVYKMVKFHPGLDFTAPQGTPVYATADGTIETAGNLGNGYGNHVVVNHGYSYKTLYGHMSRLKAKRGQKVKRGELIGYVGNTGTSTAPHLHYEVEKGTKKVNPINYFFNDISEADYEAIRDISARPTQSFD
jgi:murein DD-endopeptidase MepM/ murein hydrolase activator NlpD